jgi:hypothetical protein
MRLATQAIVVGTIFSLGLLGVWWTYGGPTTPVIVTVKARATLQKTPTTPNVATGQRFQITDQNNTSYWVTAELYQRLAVDDTFKCQRKGHAYHLPGLAPKLAQLRDCRAHTARSSRS